MKKLTYFLLYASFSTIGLYGQNVFPQKIDGCSLSKFCLDCGAPQAGYDSADFLKIGDALNGKYHFNGGKGKVGFQVLIDSSGKACVLSHTDASTQSLTRDIIGHLNECKWKPAQDHGKAVNSSIEVFFEVSNDRLTGYIRRVVPDEMIANMKNPGEPVIYNRQYVYKNPSLKSYTMTVWQKALPSCPPTGNGSIIPIPIQGCLPTISTLCCSIDLKRSYGLPRMNPGWSGGT